MTLLKNIVTNLQALFRFSIKARNIDEFVRLLRKYRCERYSVEVIDEFVRRLRQNECDRYSVEANDEYMRGARYICARLLFIDIRSTTSDGRILHLRVPGPYDDDPRCDELERVQSGITQTRARAKELFALVRDRTRLHYGIEIEGELLLSRIGSGESQMTTGEQVLAH